MVDTWHGTGPAEFVSISSAQAKVNRAKHMLEKVDGELRLTDEARKLLKGDER